MRWLRTLSGGQFGGRGVRRPRTVPDAPGLEKRGSGWKITLGA